MLKRSNLARSTEPMKRGRIKAKGESTAERDWKKKCRERDEYTCQRCFQVTLKSIHVHHVAPRSRRPDLKLDVNNGICLCLLCHSWVHAYPLKATEQGFLSTATYERAKKAVLEVY